MRKLVPRHLPTTQQAGLTAVKDFHFAGGQTAMENKKNYIALFTAVVVTVPGIIVRMGNLYGDINPLLLLLFTGMGILGAAFMLTWACEVAQMDIPQTLALAIVAFIAVLPEYAVDMYFTWMAGQAPGSAYSHYAIANMTGANRLLIGVGWSIVALLYLLKYKKNVIELFCAFWLEFFSINFRAK